MRKLIVQAWMTLDGVFDADTMDKWFIPYRSEERDEIISETVNNADAFLVGRTTYEMLAPYWSTKKNNEDGIAARLNSAPKYVVSSKLQDRDATWNNSRVIRGDVVDEVKKLKKEPGNRIVLMGSAKLVESLMPADLVDEYRLMIHPIVMGTGKRFFREGVSVTKMHLVRERPLALGVASMTYEPARD
ncbi:MAG TPA: dihydrofolate reductase family protein [Gemmatimonadaceae bacterium]|nr:dihydrofolate reductase family protein [Gemmatimonadaceae bacterium]